MALSAVLAWTATAAAAGPPAVKATDPHANSPAGVIYSIPLDNARQDAAPHSHAVVPPGGGGGTGSGGTGGGGGTAGGGGTGGPSTGGGGGSAATTKPSGGGHASPAVLVPGGEPGSLIHSANGFGSSSAVPGLNAPASAGFRSVQANASDAPVLAIVLALVVIALGALVGLRAVRSAPPRAPRPLASLPAPQDPRPPGASS
jgi:hypothetical protein